MSKPHSSLLSGAVEKSVLIAADRCHRSSLMPLPSKLLTGKKKEA